MLLRRFTFCSQALISRPLVALENAGAYIGIRVEQSQRGRRPHPTRGCSTNRQQFTFTLSGMRKIL
jgi:hypothetical protein